MFVFYFVSCFVWISLWFLKNSHPCYEEKEESWSRGDQRVGTPQIEKGLKDEVCMLIMQCLLLLLYFFSFVS